jgi:hypothetical protein
VPLEKGSIVMFIRDVAIYDKHGESLGEIKIGERAKVVGFNNTVAETYIDVHLIKRGVEIYNIHQTDVIHMEDEDDSLPIKIMLN